MYMKLEVKDACRGKILSEEKCLMQVQRITVERGRKMHPKAILEERQDAFYVQNTNMQIY